MAFLRVHAAILLIFFSKIYLPLPSLRTFLFPISFYKIPNAWHQNPCFELLSNSVQETPNLAIYSYFFWLFHRSKISSYCWKYHALHWQGLEVPKLKLIWKPPPWGLELMVPADIVQNSKGNRQPIVLLRQVGTKHINCQHGTATLRVQ